MARRRVYEPINQLKYSGPKPITLKSSWEEVFARNYCDLNPSCITWAYEAWRIPYKDPISGRQTIYIPDFLISYKTPDGKIKTSLVEIKPLHESLQEHARSRKDMVNIARNIAKWQAAIAWCERRSSVDFVVLTEAELFAGGDNIKPKRRRAQRRIKKS